MAYQLSFFGRSGEDTGASAMSSLLDELLEHGPLHGEAVGPPRPGPGQWEGPEPEAIDAFRLAISDRDQEIAFDDLLLEIHVGVRFIAETVIHADPDNEHGIWEGDLLALITLSGDNLDWTLVERIWSALKSLWPAVPWDEMSGFEIAIDHLHPPRRDPS